MTLKCIAGVETPDEGLIILNGRTLFDSSKNINLRPQERKVGLLFQNYALFPNMTLEQNIAIGIPKTKINKTEIVKEKIKTFSLEGLEKKYPNQLSGGQQQRVALARLLVSEPELILLDEPFSALDTYLRWQLEQELTSTLKDYKGTIIFVSHNRDEVYRVCDNIAIFNKGKIEVISDKKSLFKKPETVNAAVLTGCKNISRARKINDHKVFAIDWKMEVICSDFVKDDIKYIGVRSHHIDFEDEIKYIDLVNPFKLNIIGFIDDLFNKIAVLSQNNGTPIYMDLTKEQFNKIKNKTFVDVNIDKRNVLLFYS
jgi:molybdate transport system ATP-binding protein